MIASGRQSFQPHHKPKHRCALTCTILLISSSLSTVSCTSQPQHSNTLTQQAQHKLPSHEPLIDVQPVQLAGSPGQAISTPSWIIRTTVTRKNLLDRLPLFLEAAHDNYSSSLAILPKPDHPLELYLLQTRSQWALLTRLLLGDRADRFLRIDRGGFTTAGRAVLFNIGAHDTFALTAHEGWHLYSQSILKPGTLPVWLEEGIATLMEGFRWSAANPMRASFSPWANPERFDQLRDAYARKNLLSLTQLLDASPATLIDTSSISTLDYYAQVWALTLFLSEGDSRAYRNDLERLLTDAAAGSINRQMVRAIGIQASRKALRSRKGPGIFHTYFSTDLNQMNARYQHFIKQLVKTGSRDAIIQGRSPFYQSPRPASTDTSD